MTGQGSEFGGAHRFERPIDACELAQGLENTPQRRVSLESNNRNFLILHANRSLFRIRPDLRHVIWPENQIISEKTSPCALLPTRARGDQVEVPGKGGGRLCTRPSSPPTPPATAWRSKLGSPSSPSDDPPTAIEDCGCALGRRSRFRGALLQSRFRRVPPLTMFGLSANVASNELLRKSSPVARTVTRCSSGAYVTRWIIGD